MLCYAALGLVATHAVPDLNRFVWPNQWSAHQEVHLVSGKFTGALQVGNIAYDWVNKRTREDQALIAGPSVNTSFTSNNMSEWFHGTTWYYMDWTTGECQTADFGFGQVDPTFLVNPLWPHELGTIFIDTYLNTYLDASAARSSTAMDASIAPLSAATRPTAARKGFVNCSWIQVDGSAGFNATAGSSIFEWYIDSDNNARRMRMPSSLSSDLMIELTNFRKRVDDAAFKLPAACAASPALWQHGPVTPLARRYAGYAAMSSAR